MLINIWGAVPIRENVALFLERQDADSDLNRRIKTPPSRENREKGGATPNWESVNVELAIQTERLGQACGASPTN